jgi:hypothetical protein
MFRVLKTRNLLVFRDAKNAEHGKIATNWNVTGTREVRLFTLAKKVEWRAAKIRKTIHKPLGQAESAERGTSKTQTSANREAWEMVEVCCSGILQLSCGPRESGQSSKFRIQVIRRTRQRLPAFRLRCACQQEKCID